MNAYTSICLEVAFYTPFVAGVLLIRSRLQPGQEGEKAPATLVLAALVTIPAFLQLAFPALLAALERDRDLILRHGQVWRLVTALVVQDGWPVGLLAILIPLVLLGSIAERFWGWRRPLALFFGTGILSQLVGLVWQPQGAGNSVGDLGIAMGIAVLCILRARSVPPRLLGGIGIVTGLLLLPLRDIHGGATLIGAILAVLLLTLAGPLPALGGSAV